MVRYLALAHNEKVGGVSKAKVMLNRSFGTSPATSTRVDCATCGWSRQIRSATCQGCNLAARLVDLLGGGTGTVRPGLQPLYDALIGHERSATVLHWLAKPHVSAALADLGARRLEPDHAAFDALPAGKSTDHLRAMLVAVGVLPQRDEHLARLQRWITETISDHPETHLLHRYAVWHLLRRLRDRATKPLTAEQATVVRTNVTAAMALLDWLSARDLTLTTARQEDLDQWLARPTADRIAAGHFARWARRQKLTLFPACLSVHRPGGSVPPGRGIAQADQHVRGSRRWNNRGQPGQVRADRGPALSGCDVPPPPRITTLNRL